MDVLQHQYYYFQERKATTLLKTGAYFRGWAYFQEIMVYHTTGINCEDLTNPMNGGVTFNTTLNSQAHYTCNAGYCISGDRYRTCQCGGNWTGTEPTCGKQG